MIPDVIFSSGNKDDLITRRDDHVVYEIYHLETKKDTHCVSHCLSVYYTTACWSNTQLSETWPMCIRPTVLDECPCFRMQTATTRVSAKA